MLRTRSLYLCATLILAGSCGSSQKQADDDWQAPPAEKSERTIDKWTRRDEEAAIARACRNIVTPRGDFRCGVFEKSGMTPGNCGQALRGWGDTVRNEDERKAFRLLSACLGMVDSCEKVNACFRLTALAAKGSGNSTRVCGQQGINEVRLDAAKAAARYGRGTHELASVVSTREQPIEVCGLNGQLDWLTTARCADGSAPFTSREKAHAARVGNVGAGGRCSNFVDRYQVTCPEATYEVYVDFYMCGPGEKFR